MGSNSSRWYIWTFLSIWCQETTGSVQTLSAIAENKQRNIRLDFFKICYLKSTIQLSIEHIPFSFRLHSVITLMVCSQKIIESGAVLESGIAFFNLVIQLLVFSLLLTTKKHLPAFPQLGSYLSICFRRLILCNFVSYRPNEVGAKVPTIVQNRYSKNCSCERPRTREKSKSSTIFVHDPWKSNSLDIRITQTYKGVRISRLFNGNIFENHFEYFHSF